MASAAATPAVVDHFMTRNVGTWGPVYAFMAAFFGFHMPTFTFPGVPNDRLFDRVVDNAKAAEDAGFDLITVMDHFYQIRGIGPETEPMMEAYTTLSALATQTSRVKLGTLVTGVTYRNPALLAKMVTTLDVISKGRAILGIGAAWNEDEHMGYGFEFPPIAQRMDRLGEALTIAQLMFTQDQPSFEGTYYRINRALNVPRPVQPWGPTIVVGEYMDAGFGGFTFNNNVLQTKESIALAGELIKVVRGSAVPV